MAFAITKYIYPLQKEVIFSEHLDFVFDNPRTDDEVKLVKKFIELDLNDSKSDEDFPMAPILTRLGTTIYRVIETLKKLDSYEYLLKYYEENRDKIDLDFLAKMWVIIRINQTAEFDELSKNRSLVFSKMLDQKETGYAKFFKELSSYCHLVSLLSNSEGNSYMGESFLLSYKPYEIFFMSIRGGVYAAVDNYIVFNNSLAYPDRHPHWLYWNYGLHKLLEEAQRIDSLLIQQPNKELKKSLSQKQTPKQKLLHIGWLLKISHEHLASLELMLLLQVSIIEYLITRNPDTSKFNVEDSIGKQFKLKCAVIINSVEKDYNLTKLNKELTTIYDQRSDLAHGNYREIDEEEILNSVTFLYRLNRHILDAFINDRKLVEYLKDN